MLAFFERYRDNGFVFMPSHSYDSDRPNHQLHALLIDRFRLRKRSSHSRSAAQHYRLSPSQITRRRSRERRTQSLRIFAGKRHEWSTNRMGEHGA
jgi:hypothetical protein